MDFRRAGQLTCATLLSRLQASGPLHGNAIATGVFTLDFHAAYSMKKIDDIVSVDSRFRAEFFLRPDGSFGYAEFENSNGPASPVWRVCADNTSRFASHEIALFEACGRLAWLSKETAWPARDKPPAAVVEYAPHHVTCPFCGIRFSLLDKERASGGRHLTCGQRIIVTAPAG